MNHLSLRQIESIGAALQLLQQANTTSDTAKPRRSGLARVSEAAGFLSVSRPYLYKLVAQGDIPVKRIGSAIRIPWAWLEEQAATPPAE